MTLQFLKNGTALPSKPDVQLAIQQCPKCKKSLQQGYQVEAAHEYTDKDGNTLFYRVRLKKHSTGDKLIRPVYFKSGKWIWVEPTILGGKKPLYNLHAITSSPQAIIWICEGEWATDVLNRKFAMCGYSDKYIATTSGSATSCGKTDWYPLKNRNIVMWADNDKPGIEYARQVTQQLDEVNKI